MNKCVAVNGRLTSICRKALSFTAVIFNQTPILYFYTAHQRPPIKCKVRSYTIGYTRILPFSMLNTPPLIFTGVKKCRIWPRSSTPLFFKRPHFETKQRLPTKVSFGLVQRRWSSVLPKSGAAWPTPVMSRV